MTTEFPKPIPGAVIGVSALNRLARDLLEHALPLMWVRGELTNFVCATSGHCYFTLKDAGAQVRCALFRHRARALDWQPSNGMQVEVRALPTLYEQRGEFQLSVEAMRRAGVGALYEAYERLKARLDAEGLFDAARKRSLPTFPRRIGIVTSPQAAALRDALTILARRMASIPVIVYPAPVQGRGAADSIAAAIATASRRHECDVLIVCRGGGSMEDLWAFNEEAVARAIYASAIPVVTGIGHETDFTIADFVADLRAPTPTAAAQAASPDAAELTRNVRAVARRLEHAVRRRLEGLMQDVDYLGGRLLDPRSRIANDQRHLRQLGQRLRASVAQRIATARWGVIDQARRLMLARPSTGANVATLRELTLRMHAGHAHALHARTAALTALGARLEALSPLAVLARGYAIATDAKGAIVRDASLLAAGDLLNVRFARGDATARVTATRSTTPAADST